MSKYDPLTGHLAARQAERVPMSFDEIERLLGFRLPASARAHRAWWSNNASNNVMTRAWLAAGYRTEEVDLDGRRLVFRRSEPQRDVRAAAPRVAAVAHRLHGAMRGTVTLAAAYDPSEPGDPGWAGLADEA